MSGEPTRIPPTVGGVMEHDPDEVDAPATSPFWFVWVPLVIVLCLFILALRPFSRENDPK